MKINNNITGPLYAVAIILGVGALTALAFTTSYAVLWFINWLSVTFPFPK